MNRTNRQIYETWRDSLESSVPPPDETPAAPGFVHLVHDTGYRDVPPGCTAQITARPQRSALTPVALYVPPEIAEHFDLIDVCIGCRSQFPQAQAIPCSRFTLEQSERDTMVCERVQTACDFVLYVTNKSDRARRFTCVWTCELAEHPLAVELRAAQADLERMRSESLATIRAMGDEIYRLEQRHRAEIREYLDDTRFDERVREATVSFQRAFDTSQTNLTARIAQLEAELAQARSREMPIGVVKDVREDGSVEVQIGFAEGSIMQAARAALVKESKPSAVQDAPDRQQPIERWQRGAPCTWDPWSAIE